MRFLVAKFTFHVCNTRRKWNMADSRGIVFDRTVTVTNQVTVTFATHPSTRFQPLRHRLARLIHTTSFYTTSTCP